MSERSTGSDAGTGFGTTAERRAAEPISAVEALLELPFKVDSIAPVATPEGAEGVWHRYVISQGTNKITGMRAGARAEVAVLVDDMVERLNERRMGKHRAKSK